MNDRGQFSIIAALLVAVVLITTVMVTYSTIRNSPVQNQSPILSAIDETNLAIKQILGFTVGYYGSVSQVTGNVSYAKTLALNYLQSGLQNVANMHPEWGTSLSNTSTPTLQAYWFTNTSYSSGNLAVTYDLTGLGIFGVNYQTSCKLGVQILNSVNGQACLKITQDQNEPLVTLGKQNFNFYSYNNANSAWGLVNPNTEPTAYPNGTYQVDMPYGVNSNSYVVQVKDRRGIITVASSFNSYTCTLAWNSTLIPTGSPTQYYVNNYNSSIDSYPDQGTHSNFSAQQNADGVYDNVTEANSPITSGDTQQYVQSNSSNVDGNGNIGTASNFTTQQYNDNINDTLTEANAPVVSGDTQQFVQTNISDVDANGDIGTASNFTTEQSTDNTYDTLTEANTNTALYIPITFTNTRSSATPNPFQEKITWNPSSYTSYEASDLGNIRFYSDNALSIPLYSWLESCTPSLSNTATNATAWIKLTDPIAANGGTLTIYMAFLSTSTGFDGNYWGDAPNLSGTYGAYDNGAKVFSFYDNFNGTSLSSKWKPVVGSSGASIAVNNGLTVTTTSIGSTAYAFVISATQPYPAVAETYTSSGNSILGVTTTNSTNGFVAPYSGYSMDWYAGSDDLEYQRSGGGVSVGSISETTFPTGVWQVTWSANASEYFADGAGKTYTATYSGAAIANYGIYVGQSNGVIASSVFRWARMRAYPPSNVMPSASFGSVTSIPNYNLDLERRWTTASYNANASKLLCIKTGTLNTEALEVDVWTGSWTVLNTSLVANAWNNISVSSYLTTATFTIRFIDTTRTGDTVQSTWQIDSVLLHTWNLTNSYRLDIEEQWTSAPYNVNGSKLLCIKTGTLNTEALEVDVWTGSWTVLNTSLVANAWNNISVSSYLTTATFTIRFIDTTLSGDMAQSSWQIDATLLHTWNATNNYVLNLEEQWTNATYTYAALCIKTGSFSGVEAIALEAWNGTAWTSISTSLNASSWNNVTVTAYLKTLNFTIRFRGTNETSDPVQDSWQIDAALLTVWPTTDLYSLSRQGTIVAELLQNGTIRWLGQKLILTNSNSTLPFPPVPVKSIHVNETINGVNSEVPFQIEDWASAYRIPLGLTSNMSIFSSRTMIVFLATPNASKATIWWNGSDTTSQTPYAYTNRYFNDSPGSGRLSNGLTTLQVQGNFVVTSTVGASSSTANFMRINTNSSFYGSEPSYVITNGTVRDIIHQEAEWDKNHGDPNVGGVSNCSDIYADIVLTLPANTTYYTYQLRLMFVQSQQNRTISDLSPIMLTSLTGQIQTENGTTSGLPIVSNATDLFYNYSTSSWAHHWSQSVSTTTGAGVISTDSANQNLYVFDSITGIKTGAINTNSTGTIQVSPVAKSQLSFTTTLDPRMQDIIWYGAVATFDTTTPIYNTPIYNNNNQTGLWVIAEYPPTVAVTTENYQ